MEAWWLVVFMNTTTLTCTPTTSGHHRKACMSNLQSRVGFVSMLSLLSPDNERDSQYTRILKKVCSTRQTAARKIYIHQDPIPEWRLVMRYGTIPSMNRELWNEEWRKGKTLLYLPHWPTPSDLLSHENTAVFSLSSCSHHYVHVKWLTWCFLGGIPSLWSIGWGLLTH